MVVLSKEEIEQWFQDALAHNNRDRETFNPVLQLALESARDKGIEAMAEFMQNVFTAPVEDK